jgi:predicted GH43/DUF377 family glycosyl hydrolase
MAPVQLKDTKEGKFQLLGLGAGTTKNQTVLFYSTTQNNQPFRIAVADQTGFNFKPISQKLKFGYWWQEPSPEISTTNYRLSQTSRKYILTYLEKTNSHYQLKYRLTRNLVNWSKPKKIPGIGETGMILPKTKTLIYGRKDIKKARFRKLSQSALSNKSIFQLKERVLGRSNFKISQIFDLKQGYLALFYCYQDPDILSSYSWMLMLLNKNRDHQIQWTKQMPITGTIPDAKDKKIAPLGSVKINNQLISYWQLDNQNIYGLSQPFFEINQIKPPTPFPYLKKFDRAPENPILKPQPKNNWESKLVFNPAAVKGDEKVHLVYRATGDDDTSKFGYASTKDGINIDYRSDEPIYLPRRGFETNEKAPIVTAKEFVSGGGAGGCEDPKLTKIKDKIYMTYTAWDGANHPRVALTSINSDDFFNQIWNWQIPILISPPNEIHKNWALFPNKIRGKYAMITGIVPEIEIFYLNNLHFKNDRYLRSERPRGVQINPETQNTWDNLLRGAGPPPLETNDGWLILYHAMDKRDPNRYKLGAMVTDKNDPTEVLYRSNTPLLEPDMDYENEGFKAGVVYSCGAVVRNKHLLVYYGGADTVSCVAQMKLDQLLNQMKLDQEIRLRPAKSVFMYN